MKHIVKKYYNEEIELTFSRWVEVPTWAFAYTWCDKCEKDFESVSKDENTVIRARDDQLDDYWVFCKDCFREELLH